MLTWLLSQQLWLCIVLVVLSVCERYLLPYLGARFILRLWWALPLGLLYDYVPNDMKPTLATDLGHFSVTAEALPSTAWSFSFDVIYLIVSVLLLGLCFAQHYGFTKQLHPYKDSDNRLRSTEVSAPLIMGFLPATLVLPADFEKQFTHTQQTMILAHENTHLRRYDNQFSALFLCLACLTWFNPLVWVGFASFRRIQELACDEVVLANQPTSVRLDYGRALMHSLTLSQRIPKVFSQYGDKEMMQQRLNNLRDTRRVNNVLQAVLAAGLLASLSVYAGNSDSNSTTKMESSKHLVQPVMRIEPRYPKAAVDQKIEGYVQLQFKIDEKGRTHSIQVLHGEPQALFDAASLDALQQWTYTNNPNPNELFTVQLDYLLGHDSVSKNKQEEMEQITVGQ
ncbi:TonB family protein [Pseudoalteromonas xiamenensis]